MIVVTGGAGFIGSNLLAALEARGETELAVCDWLGTGEKWRNIAKREVAAIVRPDELIAFLDERRRDIEAVFHLGAISTTTETDGDRIVAANISASRRIWDWCARHEVRLLYASSAATYGSGAEGFDDDDTPEALARLRPLNLYGWSKHVFDRSVARLVTTNAPRPPQWVGLKFFNVFGPNEYHKGPMMSVVAQLYPKVTAGEPARLFRSHRPDVPDGGQKRDFVYVEDCLAMMLWLYDNPEVSGLYNIGTGQARSFAELATAVFRAAGREPRIEYVDTPETLRGQYQYFTQARMDRLQAAGYAQPPMTLEAAVGDYVKRYLAAADPYR